MQSEIGMNVHIRRVKSENTQVAKVAISMYILWANVADSVVFLSMCGTHTSTKSPPLVGPLLLD